jgi:hypothetical protein
LRKGYTCIGKIKITESRVAQYPQPLKYFTLQSDHERVFSSSKNSEQVWKQVSNKNSLLGGSKKKGLSRPPKPQKDQKVPIATH